MIWFRLYRGSGWLHDVDFPCNLIQRRFNIMVDEIDNVISTLGKVTLIQFAFSIFFQRR